MEFWFEEEGIAVDLAAAIVHDFHFGGKIRVIEDAKFEFSCYFDALGILASKHRKFLGVSKIGFDGSIFVLAAFSFMFCLLD